MKYLGFPLPKLETIYPIWAKGCRKIRDAEFFEDIRYRTRPRNNTIVTGLKWPQLLLFDTVNKTTHCTYFPTLSELVKMLQGEMGVWSK